MDRVVTFREFVELKEWMVLHFATKQDLAAIKQEVIEFKSGTLTRFDKVFGFLEKSDKARLFMHDAPVRIEEKLSK